MRLMFCTVVWFPGRAHAPSAPAGGVTAFQPAGGVSIAGVVGTGVGVGDALPVAAGAPLAIETAPVVVCDVLCADREQPVSNTPTTANPRRIALPIL